MNAELGARGWSRVRLGELTGIPKMTNLGRVAAMAEARVIHLHIHIPPEEPDHRIDTIIGMLTAARTQGETMATDLTALTAEVEANAAVDQSAIVLLDGIKAALDAAGTDPAALAALSDSLGTSTAELAAAVARNTPAAVEPPA